MGPKDNAGLPAVTERVRWLFDAAITRAPHSGATPDLGAPRRWTVLEVAQYLGRRLDGRGDGGDLAAWVNVVEQLCSGRRGRGPELDALADFFGVSPDYFGDDPPQVIAAQEEVLGRTMRECGVLAYRLCHRVFLRPDSPRVPTVEEPTCQDHLDVGGLSSALTGASGTPGSTVDVTDLGIELPLDRPMTAAGLRELCARLLTELNLVPPLTPQRLCERLAAARERRIKLVADELFTTASVGHLFVKPRRDVIGYHRSATPQQQAQVIYHEVMHLVLGHISGVNSLTCGALDEDADRDTSWPRREGLYTRWQEWEAETGATFLSGMSRQRARPRLLTGDAPAADRGIAGVFGLTDGGWR